jgi:GTPase
MFIDEAKITCIAGHGGQGCSSFRREKYIPKGGPDGGDGGLGGSVVIVADERLRSLMDYKYKRTYQAQNGFPGEGRQKHGKNAIDMILKVPCGTIVYDAETEDILCDMKENNQEFVVVVGGKGGLGNMNFATSIRQAPQYAQPGLSGEESVIRLELKLLADVGLLGFPNVGKSTLISKVTDAKPKIANYHFTTLVPNLGVVKYDVGQSFVIADIPGIIEGAHDGVGLGHQFLRHVERTGFLLHLLDVSGIEGRDPKEDFKILNKELECFSSELSKKEQVVVLNKADLVYDKEHIADIVNHFKKKKFEVFVVSAATTEGLKEVIDFCALKLQLGSKST